jgi:hypothetical protein
MNLWLLRTRSLGLRHFLILIGPWSLGCGKNGDEKFGWYPSADLLAVGQLFP